MTDSSGLERRYRRLLALYPRAFRTEREEEMLAVLMAGAAEGPATATTRRVHQSHRQRDLHVVASVEASA
jgi:hypothetical protein